MPYEQLNPSERILLGPGPSQIHPRVYRAIGAPVVGHLDPEFLAIMEDTKNLLRFVFQTKNYLTIPMSGTGSAGMETCLVNLLEPADKALICINGVFGTRMKDIIERCGAVPIVIEAEWGRAIDPADVEKSLKNNGAKLVAVVHAETSTGVLQPLEDISKIAKEHGALFLVDTVTSLGGTEVKVDDWGMSACYSGTQKCLSCPPGLSPVTFNDAALVVVHNRKTKVQSWYLDLTMIERYWGEERVYHHTAPISMNYALREALLLVKEEGLTSRFERHLLNHKALVAGIEAMGLRMLVPPAERAPMLNAICVPEGIDEAKIRKQLLEKYSIEVGAGLGPLKGKIWRVGLMGHSSRAENVMLFLMAFERVLKSQGFKMRQGAGIEIASDLLGV